MGLYLDPEGSFRLKSFSSASRGTKATIKIEVETDNLDDMGFFLGSLARLQEQQEQQKREAAAKRNPTEKQNRLAPPKPVPV